MVRQSLTRFCCSAGRAAAPISEPPALLRRWRAEWPFPSPHPGRRPPGARVRSSGPGSSASSATSPHVPPPASPYPAPTSAACTRLPRVGTNPATIRNCATAESIRSPWAPICCLAPAPAPVAEYPPAELPVLALPTLRAEQSNTLPCFPSLPTLPVELSAPPPYASVPASSHQSWLFLDHFPPASERTPNAVRSPNQSPPHSVASGVIPEAVVCCSPSSQFPVFPAS